MRLDVNEHSPNYYEMHAERQLFLIGNVESDLQLNRFFFGLFSKHTHERERKKKEKNQQLNNMNLFFLYRCVVSVYRTVSDTFTACVHEPV